jgi:hypothetical protein
MRRRTVQGLKALDAIAVENPIRPGTPDINFVEGWIELKYLSKWPKGADENPVFFLHFTLQQRIWLTRRRLYGGRAYLLLQVQQDWLLFDGVVAAEHVGKVTRPRLIELAEARWLGGMNFKELTEWLRPSVSA